MPTGCEDVVLDNELAFPEMVLVSEKSLECIGNPISVAELALLALVEECAERLNIWGNRARLNEDDEPPSTGCICWKASNSMRRELRARRYSKGVELTSSRGGRERPRRRKLIARRETLRWSK